MAGGFATALSRGWMASISGPARVLAFVDPHRTIRGANRRVLRGLGARCLNLPGNDVGTHPDGVRACASRMNALLIEVRGLAGSIAQENYPIASPEQPLLWARTCRANLVASKIAARISC